MISTEEWPTYRFYFLMGLEHASLWCTYATLLACLPDQTQIFECHWKLYNIEYFCWYCTWMFRPSELQYQLIPWCTWSYWISRSYTISICSFSLSFCQILDTLAEFWSKQIVWPKVWIWKIRWYLAGLSHIFELWLQ